MSKKILLLTDSSTTMSKEDASKYDVEILPLAIYRNDGKEYINNLDELTASELFNMNDEGYTFKTSCTPQLLLEDTISQKLTTYDYIIALPISEKWSSQYSHLKALSNEPEFKDRLFVANVLEFGFALENLCIDLRQMIDNGQDDPKTLIEYANNFHKKTVAFFACKNLEGLVASGRVPKVIAKLFKLTKIYPVIRIEAENHLDSIVKNWNEVPNKCIKALIKTYGKLLPEDVKQITILTAGNSQDYINEVRKDLAKAIKIDENLIQTRVAPNVFVNIVSKDAIGFHIIANKNKQNTK